MIMEFSGAFGFIRTRSPGFMFETEEPIFCLPQKFDQISAQKFIQPKIDRISAQKFIQQMQMNE